MPTAKVNGADIFYEDMGSGPPVILSPGGLQGALESYRPVLEGLSQRYRVVVYDRRFGGQSRSPLVVQTWDMVCEDVMGLMDHLGIEEAYLGGGSFGSAISLGSAYRFPQRVRAIFPSNVAGGVICDSYLATKLFRGLDMAMNHGVASVVDAFDPDDRFSPFSPEIAQTNGDYREVVGGHASRGVRPGDERHNPGPLRRSLSDHRHDQGDAQVGESSGPGDAREQRHPPPGSGGDGPPPGSQLTLGRGPAPLRGP